MGHQLANFLTFVHGKENQTGKDPIVRIKAINVDNGKNDKEATLYNLTLEIEEFDDKRERLDPKYLVRVYEMLISESE